VNLQKKFTGLANQQHQGLTVILMTTMKELSLLLSKHVNLSLPVIEMRKHYVQYNPVICKI